MEKAFQLVWSPTAPRTVMSGYISRAKSQNVVSSAQRVVFIPSKWAMLKPVLGSVFSKNIMHKAVFGDGFGQVQ